MEGVARIETTAALDAFLAGIGGGPLALDTEADSFHHYRDKVCLVQLTAGGRHALVDPLAAVDVTRLAPVLADRAVPKILHGADYDVRILHRDYKLTVGNLFDTMIASRLCGDEAVGLAALLERYLGVRHDKAHQRADWSKRPLTDGMVAYAVEDTRHLEALAATLAERLEATGRTAWAREEFARVEAARWRDARDDDPEPFRRVKGAGSLDRAGLAVLREAWGWRDAMARRRDKPAFRILRDESLLALAKAPPATVGDLARVAGFPEYLLRSPAAGDLVAAARRGASLPESDRPELRIARRPAPEPEVEAEVSRLKAVRDRVAAALGLDPAVVASRGLLEDIARRRVAGGDPWAGPDLRAWQRDLLAPQIA